MQFRSVIFADFDVGGYFMRCQLVVGQTGGMAGQANGLAYSVSVQAASKP